MNQIKSRKYPRNSLGKRKGEGRVSGWDLYFGSIRLKTITGIIVTILIFGFGALYLASEDKLILASFVALVGILTCFVMYYDYRRKANQ